MNNLGFELEFIDTHSININNKSELNKIFNNIEDLCYFYETYKNDINQETKDNIESYIISVSRWTNLNKISFGNYNHKYLEIFKSIQTDLTGIDDLVSKIITPIHNNTMYNWLSYFKSSDAFYAIKGNHKINSDSSNKVEEILNSALINAKKSIKTEKMAGYHLYIVSGKASKDYIENATGSYYKQKAEIAINRKDIDVIAPSGTYDGMALSNDTLEENTILFATTNENTDTQDVFKVLKKEKNSKIMFVFAPTFNQKYSYIDTQFNGRKAEQHGTAFLKQFNSDFSFNDLGDFNMLPFMALINNFEIPENTGLKVSDFLKINPFAYGTDTYSIYRSLRDINEYYEPQKTEKLQEYLVDYLVKITTKLSSINQNFTLNSDTEDIIMNTQKIILGTLNNFNKSNLKNEIPNEDILNKLFTVIQNYNITVSKLDVDSENSKVSTKIKSMELKRIIDKDDLLYVLKQRNRTINIKYEDTDNQKIIPLNNYNANSYFDLLNQDFDIPHQKAKKIVDILLIRQENSKQNTFTPESLKTDLYSFFYQHKDIEPYKIIFKFIENSFDFNNPVVRDELKSVLSLKKYNNESETLNNLSIKDKINQIWKSLTSGKNYKINESLIEFISTIEQAGYKGTSIYSVCNTQFYKTQVLYKESQPSYWKLASNSPKTNAHKELMKILGIYDFTYEKKMVFSSAMMNDNLDKYLNKKNKIKI